MDVTCHLLSLHSCPKRKAREPTIIHNPMAYRISSLRHRILDWSAGSSVSSPELTPRAVILGLMIGCLLCFTNLYFGLQTGWISMMSLQSALLGYLLARLIPSLSPLTPQENVVLQTTAVATGTMPLAAGFVGIIPALGLLELKKDGQGPVEMTWLTSIGWSCAVAYFGVFLAAPLRKQVIIKEKLVFPSGTATAQLISVMHGEAAPGKEGVPSLRRRGTRGEEYSRLDSHPDDEGTTAESPAKRDGKSASGGWLLLAVSFLASGALTLSAYFFPVLFSIPLFGRYLAREWLWSFSPSLSYVGQGIIMGFPTTLSMNLGMLAGWAILNPISKSSGWAPGSVGSMEDGARGWILWVALAIMSAESLVSLLPVILEIAQNMRKVVFQLLEEADTTDEDEESSDRLVPTAWVVRGIAGSVIFGTGIVWAIFGADGIRPWATLLAFAIGSVLGLLGVRALGETDLNPVSGLGKLAQLLFAFLQPGNVVANIIAGGVAEAGAQQAGDLMQDLKTGHLLHASPRAQFYGQVIGSTLSIFVSATAYRLYVRAYSIPSPNFPAPTAFVWLSLARLLRNGSLPPHSSEFMLWFGLAAVIVAAIKVRASSMNHPWAKWVPSGVAFAMGFLNTPNFSMARLVGGIIEVWYHSRQKRRQKGGEGDVQPALSGISIIVVASGFVLGEGVVSILGLALKSFGIEGSCWGCSGGICPTCPA
ncbi:hypothetical protein FRB94_004344 [Tulasnella sp. JGI-2019a]|nr:hypothetical protein FRB93_000345 [Tulasnella sp. JGI-2019a]KAG9015225.1 hypothetical protein FRB94_004344 [Tulasnella sp. JGI-2019a]